MFKQVQFKKDKFMFKMIGMSLVVWALLSYVMTLIFAFFAEAGTWAELRYLFNPFTGAAGLAGSLLASLYFSVLAIVGAFVWYKFGE